MQVDEMVRKLDAVIGQIWGTDVTEAKITEITKCDDLRVVPDDQVVPADFQGGRFTVWLDKESRISQVTYEMRSGGLLIVPS